MIFRMRMLVLDYSLKKDLSSYSNIFLKRFMNTNLFVNTVLGPLQKRDVNNKTSK